MEITNFDAWVFILFGLLIYLLPSYIALQKRSIMTGSIFFLNLFLGWTILIWVICFVWAATTDR
jgi:hypothetical protein